MLSQLSVSRIPLSSSVVTAPDPPAAEEMKIFEQSPKPFLLVSAEGSTGFMKVTGRLEPCWDESKVLSAVDSAHAGFASMSLPMSCFWSQTQS